MFGAGVTTETDIRQFVAGSFDGNENHIQAYESWLEDGDGEFLGEIQLMPDLSRSTGLLGQIERKIAMRNYDGDDY